MKEMPKMLKDDEMKKNEKKRKVQEQTHPQSVSSLYPQAQMQLDTGLRP